ncbi:MAG: cytochrome c [Acidobacteria bacterium]|nr:cytochrome c [Acidobacteriota bacterium]
MNHFVVCRVSGKLFIEAMLFLLVMPLAIPSATVQAQQPTLAQASPSTETIAKGKQNFVTYACFACHGYSGQGAETGPRIDTSRRTLSAFVSYVRKPGRAMPPFRTQSQISDSALAEIYAFLKSVPPPPDPNSIPLLNTK